MLVELNQLQRSLSDSLNSENKVKRLEIALKEKENIQKENRNKVQDLIEKIKEFANENERLHNFIKEGKQLN